LEPDRLFSAVSSGLATVPPVPVVSPDDFSRSDLSGDSPATNASQLLVLAARLNS
jgi:hypothetical protein